MPVWRGHPCSRPRFTSSVASIRIAQMLAQQCYAASWRVSLSRLSRPTSKIEAKIEDSIGEYLELKALIGKATAEPALRLTKEHKECLGPI